MSKVLLSILLMAGFTATAQQVVREGHPKLTYKDTIFNFGAIKKGAEIDAAYSFTNTGDVPVIMKKVKPSCEAITVVSFPDKPIFPGQQQEIRVRFNSELACAGAKFITVETSEKKSFRKLHITGHIK
jgi:hypothetical protein